MRGDIKLARDADRLYRIKPHERRLMYAGVTADSKQVLMGLYCPYLVAIFFDERGDVLDVQKRVLPFMVEQIERGVGTNIYDLRIEPRLKEWQGELGYQPATIQVHRFFVLEECGNNDEQTGRRSGVGIVDYPSFYHDVFTHPANHTQEEREQVQEALPRWEEEGQFVLWWGNDYWFDKSGECVAS
jgi:hypothetical protein